MAAHFVSIALVAQENGPKKALENPGSNDFLAAMGGARSGLPFFIFLDAKGKKLADSNVVPVPNQPSAPPTNIGCPAAPEEIVAFGELLKKTAPRLSDTQRQTILDEFTKAAPKR